MKKDGINLVQAIMDFNVNDYVEQVYSDRKKEIKEYQKKKLYKHPQKQWKIHRCKYCNKKRQYEIQPTDEEWKKFLSDFVLDKLIYYHRSGAKNFDYLEWLYFNTNKKRVDRFDIDNHYLQYECYNKYVCLWYNMKLSLGNFLSKNKLKPLLNRKQKVILKNKINNCINYLLKIIGRRFYK